MSTVSVLMSTYHGERASYLAQALASIDGQSVPPDQVVLVVDGPIGADQEAVIAPYVATVSGPVFTVVRLERGRGLSGALNAGLVHCTGRYVMRMDSDDLSLPDRLQIQRDYAAAHPEIDVVACWCEEFADDDRPSRRKVSPVQHEAIAQALRWRNVLVHPSVMIRTETLRRIGGYRTDFGKLEDYDLFVRLILAGARFHAIPKILVRFRTSADQMKRRGGLRYCLDEIRFRTACWKRGFLDLRSFVVTTAMYVVFRLVSQSMRRRLYDLVRA